MAGRLAQWTALDVASGWCEGEREFPPILTRYSFPALPRTRFPCVPCARCARALGISSRGVRDVACRRGAVMQGVCRARRGGSGPSRCAAQCTAARWWATRLGKEQAQKRAQPPSQLPRAAAQRPSLPQPARRCATVRLDRAYAIDWRQVHHNQSPAHGARPCGCFAASSAAISGDLRKSGNPEIRKWRRRAAAVGPQRDLELGAGRRVRPGSRSHSKASTIGKKCDLTVYEYSQGTR